MQHRRLGGTDIEVSTVAMGCWAIVGGGTWGPQDEKNSLAAIETALEVGITFFDTAEAYGNGRSEEMLGQVLRGRWDQVVISSKVSPANQRPADLKAACEASLRRLQTECIDLYQMHWPNWDVPIEETLGAMEELKAEGKIRVVGCSNFGPKDLADLLAHGRAEVDQVAYNMLFRAVESKLQPLCVEHGVSILPYSPMAQGLLTGKFASADDVPDSRARTRHFSSSRPGTSHDEAGAEKETFEAIEAVRSISEQIGAPMAQVALAWLLAQPAVPSVLAGARNPEQVRTNAGAADLELPQDALERLSRATDPLKQRMGAHADMWRTGTRIR